MFTDIKSKWDDILEKVREDRGLTDVSYRTWILPLIPVSLSNKNVLTVYFPGDSFAASFVENRYGFFLHYAIEEITGTDCTLKFVTTRDENREDAPASRHDFSIANLNSRYTFDSFVVGQNNKLAHAASLAVAEAPGEIYNPLYIYGGAGLGKTHLMQSIAHFVLKENPKARVLYVTCEKFLNDYVDALANKNNTTMTDFREKYRFVDVLLIDDIQFISKKFGMQEELFHTFNALYGANKQIVISSDRVPKEIDDLEERLRTRFEQGLTADIGLPDFETRMAILRKKEEIAGYNIDNEVIKYIASNIKSNIRELEGALTKIVALSRVTVRPITLELAEEALRDQINPDAPREITLPYILEVVSDHFGIRTSDIIGKKKDAEIVFPRQIVMYLAKELTQTPLKNIGQFLGGRDHTTVLHGKRKIEEQLQTDESLRNVMEVLRKKIKP
ncbi:MAG: chromosomal replication initiator protein DnaA [Lachnospiraceae bacterium]|nr:chromosomal replication initiator protein DnaA [Lachnospiraceae bacterium]